MNSHYIPTHPGMPIGTIERETGLTRDALRKWELRYGFPVPERDEQGERVYPLAQLDQLRLIKRLLDKGMRPAKIVGLDIRRLRELADACLPVASQQDLSGGFAEAVFGALENRDSGPLQRVLAQELMRIGLGEFVQARLAQLNRIVGDAWADGRLAVYQEHLYAEAVQTLLRDAIGRLPASIDGTRIVLATAPGELHSLGILMVQAQLSLAGARCISLGSQVPMGELAAAADAYDADVVGLSFSVAYPVRRIAPQLTELRKRLDPAVQVWAGGQGMGRVRGIPAGVHAPMSLAEAAIALATFQSPGNGLGEPERIDPDHAAREG
jgi:methanogenic corrinoid protein MtbC1